MSLGGRTGPLGVHLVGATWRSIGGKFGAPWGYLESLEDNLGVTWGGLMVTWGHLGSPVVHLEVTCWQLGGRLGFTWGHLWALGSYFGVT